MANKSRNWYVVSIWVCFISVEALQHVPCCVLRPTGMLRDKPSKRNTKHATQFFLNSFETHPFDFSIPTKCVATMAQTMNFLAWFK